MASAQGRHPRRRLLRVFALSREALRATASPKLAMWRRSILELPEDGAALDAGDKPMRQVIFLASFRYMNVRIFTYNSSCIDS